MSMDRKDVRGPLSKNTKLYESAFDVAVVDICMY